MRPFDRADPSIVDGRWRLLKVSAAREIPASADQIWAVVSDHTTWTSWHEDYDQHDALTDRVSGLGAQFATKEWVLRSEGEIVRWEPSRAIGLSVIRAANLRWLLRSYYFEIVITPLDGPIDRCRVEYTAAFKGTVAFWLLSAYTVAQSLGTIYFDARSTLKKLEAHIERQRRSVT